MIRKSVFGLFFLILVLIKVDCQNIWYVSPDGGASGNGSVNSPWDIATMFASPASVNPGDTILLRGGIYKGHWTCNLNGNEGKRITIKSYPGEIAVLDSWEYNPFELYGATLTVNGNFVTLRDFVITFSSPYRSVLWQTVNSDSWEYPTGVTGSGNDMQIINMIIHHTGSSAIHSYSSMERLEAHGNILFGCGFTYTHRGAGFGFYSQNIDGKGYKYIDNNIMMKMYEYGMKVYGESSDNGSLMCNYYIRDNIAFMNGLPNWSIDGSKAVGIEVGGTNLGGENVFIENNSVWQTINSRGAGIQAGYIGPSKNVDVLNNTISGGYPALRVLNMLTNSSVYGNFIYSNNNAVSYSKSTNGDGAFEVWNNNTYFQDPNTMLGFANDNGDYYSTWESWKNNHRTFDTNSSFSRTIPGSNIINIYPNKYDDDRAHVAIYNYEKLSTVNLDLSDIFEPGDSLVIYDVENILNGKPIIKTIYNGNIISLPVNSTSEINVNPGYPDEVYHSPIDFGAFIALGYSLNIPNVFIESDSDFPVYSIDKVEQGNGGDVTVHYSGTGRTDERQVDFKLCSATQGGWIYEEENVSSPFTFNMQDVAPEAGTDRFIINIITDSTFVQETFDYSSGREFEMYAASITETNLMTTYHFQATSGYDEYGYLYGSEDRVLGDSVLHWSVAGKNTIFYKYYYGEGGGDVPKGETFTLKVWNSDTDEEVSVNITKTDGYDKLTILDITPNTTLTGKTWLNYYKGKNYEETIYVLNSSNEIVKVIDDTFSKGNIKYLIDISNHPDGIYTVVIDDGYSKDTETFVKGAVKGISIIEYGPNPTYDSVQVKFYSSENMDVLLSCLDSEDSEVFSKNIDGIKGYDNSVFVDLSKYESGDYKVVLSNGQVSDTCLVTKMDKSPLKIISYGPNPTSDIVNVVLFVPQSGTISLSVGNSQGEEVLNQNFTVTEGNNDLVVELGTQADGIYSLNFSSDTETVSCQVTKESELPMEIVSYGPNPTSDIVNVVLFVPQSGTISLSVGNSQGEEVLNQNFTVTEGNNDLVVELGTQADGIYSLNFSSDTETVSCQVTKESELPMEIVSYGPNPTSDIVNVVLFVPQSGTISLLVGNSQGEEVLNQNFTVTEGNNDLVVELGTQADGIYSLNFSSDTETVSCQVTKESELPMEIVNYGPNPTSDIVNVVLFVPQSGTISLLVGNSQGEEVLNQNFTVTEGNNDLVVELGTQADGIYSLNFSSDTETVSCQVTKESELPMEIVSYGPNPTSDIVNVVLFVPQSGTISLSVGNSQGEEVLNQNFTVTEGNNDLVVELGTQADGIYSLNFSSDAETVSCQVTKESELPMEIVSYGPNPTTDAVTVVLFVPESGSISLTVENRQGVEVQNQTYRVAEGNNDLLVELGTQADGNYTLSFSSDRETVSCQVSKESELPLEIVSYGPNPTYDFVTIVLFSPKTQPAYLSVTNSIGQEIQNQQYTLTEGNNSIEIDLNMQVEGTYTLLFSAGGEKVSCNVVKINYTGPPQSIVIKEYTETTYDIASITFYCPSQSNVLLTVQDDSGTTVLSQNISPKEGDNLIDINLSAYVEGVYRITLDNEGSSDYCDVTKLKNDEDGKFELISISPNPTVDILTIEFSNPQEGDIHVEIFEEFGRKVLEDYFKVNSGKNKIVLDLSSLQSGVYNIVVDNGIDSKLNAQVVKESIVDN